MNTIAIIILAFSMMNFSHFGVSQKGFGVAQGQPSSLYPVNVTLGTGEKVLFADHTSDLEEGNWIELSGGIPITLPSLTLAYDGPDTATYTRDITTVTIESTFTQLQVTYPLTTHPIYLAGQSVTAKFWGSTSFANKDVEFRLFQASSFSLSQVKEILNNAFQGDLTDLRDALRAPYWSTAVTLDTTGDGTVSFNAPSEAGEYLLVVLDDAGGSPYELYIYSATLVEVVDYTLDVSAPSSVEKGDDVYVELELTDADPGSYIYGAVMIKESACSGEIKLSTNGSLTGTNLTLNGALIANGTFAREFVLDFNGLSDITINLITEQLVSFFGTDKLVLGFTTRTESTTESIALMTESLTPGDYMLLVGAWENYSTKIVGLNQTTVTILSPPVADAGGPYSGRPGRAIAFDGTWSYDPDGDIVSYAWNFGDGETGTGAKTSHVYDDEGTYTVTLTVTDNDDLTDSDTTTTTVSRPPPPPKNKKPKADAGPNVKISVGSIIHFSGAGSYDPDGEIVSYRWDFGDGAKDSGMNVSHVYSELGHYTVTLTVKDNRGAEDSDKCHVKVWEPPVPVMNRFGELVPGKKKGHIVDALEVANTTVTLNTTETVTVTILIYEDNPHPEDPIPATALPTYVDVEVSNATAIEWPIYVEMCYTDEEVEGIDESSLGIYYWMDGAWQRCSDTGVDTERNVVWAYMTAEEASGSPILIGGITSLKPAEFVVSYLKIEPRQIELGGTVTISVNVTNVGETPGSYNVTLNIEEGLIISVKEVTLQGGESEIVEFEFVPEAERTYDVDIEGMIGTIYVIIPIPVPPLPPYLSNLTVTPNEIKLGDNVTISLDIRDMHNQSFTYIVTMQIDQLTLLIDVELEPYEFKTVSQTITPEMIGEYHVWVQGLTGSFTVKALPEPEFEVSYLTITPEEIELGDEVTISFIITNNDSRSYVFVPFVQIGDTMIMEDVELEGHESRTVSHTITPESVGNYDVTIDGLEGSFTVKPRPTAPFWMRPGYVAGILIVIVSAGAIIYTLRKRQVVRAR